MCIAYDLCISYSFLIGLCTRIPVFSRTRYQLGLWRLCYCCDLRGCSSTSSVPSSWFWVCCIKGIKTLFTAICPWFHVTHHFENALKCIIILVQKLIPLIPLISVNVHCWQVSCYTALCANCSPGYFSSHCPQSHIASLKLCPSCSVIA